MLNRVHARETSIDYRRPTSTRLRLRVDCVHVAFDPKRRHFESTEAAAAGSVRRGDANTNRRDINR
jgi:hypothetical protein